MVSGGVSVGLCLAVLVHQGVGEECRGGEDCLDEDEGSGEYVGVCGWRSGFFPDLSQCDKYHECRDGQVRNIPAGNGNIFDTVHVQESSHLCPDGLVYDKQHFKADFQVTSLPGVIIYSIG